MNETPGNVSDPVEAARSHQGVRTLGALDPQQSIELTVRVRPRAPVDPERIEREAILPPAQRHYPSRQEYATAHGADPNDLAQVAAFARDHGLTVKDSSPSRRSVILSGPAAAIEKAFGVGLSLVATDQGTFHVPTGPVAVPPDLSRIIEAVIGLDNRPHAHAHDTDPSACEDATPPSE